MHSYRKYTRNETVVAVVYPCKAENGIAAIVEAFSSLSHNGRRLHGNRDYFTGRQIQGKVVSIAFVHDIGTEIDTVDYVRPRDLRSQQGIVGN